MTQAKSIVERAAEAIDLDFSARLETPFGWRHAIDKSGYEVYHLDYPEWREVVDEATIVARYQSQAKANGHALRLQKQWAAKAALLSALEPTDEVVEAMAQALADNATAQRKELRMMRQGIDLSRAEPASPAIFRQDVRIMLSALRAIVEGDGK